MNKRDNLLKRILHILYQAGKKPKTIVQTETAHKNASTQSGFSVLEALVAIAILATAFLPLLDLQMQFVRTAESIERAHTRNALTSQAITRLHGVNFSQFPTGQYTLGGSTLSWQATPVPYLDSVERGRYIVKLYNVTVNVTDTNGRILSKEQLLGNGWHPKKSYKNSIF